MTAAPIEVTTYRNSTAATSGPEYLVTSIKVDDVRVK